MGDVIGFPGRRPATRAMRFTRAHRQAVVALGYLPGLVASIGQDEDGDEWACIQADADELGGLEAVTIIVAPQGFTVSLGWSSIGTFEDIHVALDAARRAMADAMGTFEPRAFHAATWAAFAPLLGAVAAG